jgi:hypothetical protein
MADNIQNIELPWTVSSNTWDGLTWALTSVDGDDTRFASTLSLVRFQLQDSTGAVALTLTSATAEQVTINTATANAWSVTVEPRILTLTAGVYSFGLEFTDSASVVKTYLAGTLEIKPDRVI